MNSFHDYYIHGVEIDSLEKEVRFKLAWPEDEKPPKISYLIFKGVFGYEISNDSMASIVESFEEITLSKFLSYYGNEIKESYRQNGAYGPWAHDLSKAESELSTNNLKAIILSSSMGMVGWVLAQKIEVQNA